MPPAQLIFREINVDFCSSNFYLPKGYHAVGVMNIIVAAQSPQGLGSGVVPPAQLILYALAVEELYFKHN